MSTKHNRLKNPNWREADQLALYKHDRGVELGSTEKCNVLERVKRVGVGEVQNDSLPLRAEKRKI